MSQRESGKRSRLLLSEEVVAVLRLRRWLRSLLAGRQQMPAYGDLTQGLGLFLESERCALPLERALRMEGMEHAALGQIAGSLIRRSGEEAKRVRLAREALALAGEIACESDLTVVVLRGGVTVADDAKALDLVDVDLLAPPQEARRLVAALDKRGFRVAGPSSPRHLKARIKDDGIPIEIHTTLSNDGAPLPDGIWERIHPLGAVPGIYRLGCGDHLWHLLEHTVVDHPERRGLTRELLLIGYAIAECSDDDLVAVNKRIETHSLCTPFRAAYEAGDDLRKGRYDRDLLESVAATFYAVRVVLLSFNLPRVLETYIYRWSFAWLLGRVARHSLREEIWSVSLDPSVQQPVAWLEQRVPPIARPFRLAFRLARAVIAAAIALPVSFIAGRVARLALYQVEHDRR